MFHRSWKLASRATRLRCSLGPRCPTQPSPTVCASETNTRRIASSSKCLGSSSSDSDSDNKSVLPDSLSSLNLRYMEADVLRKRFDAYDENSDGYIDVREAIQLVKDADGHNENGSIGEKDCAELAAGAEEITRSLDKNNDGRVDWSEFKEAVDRAALPISSRVYPISGTMMINFTAQGVMLPVLPYLATSVGLATSQLGMVTASAALARVVSNVPAAFAAETFGRRPMLIFGPVLGAVGMAGFALAPTDTHAFASFCAANAM